MPYVVTDTLSGDRLVCKSAKEVYEAVDYLWPDPPLIDSQQRAKADLLAEFNTWDDPESITAYPVESGMLGAHISWIGRVK